MKNRFLTMIPAMALLAVAIAGPAPAQAAEISAHVPFSFTVRGTTLPAGTYMLFEKGGALFVQGATAAAVVLTSRLESRETVRPSVVFHRYGDRYILRQAWTGDLSGRGLPEEKMERELALSAKKARTAGGFERIVIRAL